MPDRKRPPRRRILSPEQRRMLTVSEAADYCGVGRSLFYEKVVGKAHVTFVKIGGRSLVRRTDLDAYLDSL